MESEKERPTVKVQYEKPTAVDLGAARTRVYVKGAGLVVDQPSAAAVNTRTGALIAVGEFAEKMTGRTPSYIRVVRPVSGGTVVGSPPESPHAAAISSTAVSAAKWIPLIRAPLKWTTDEPYLGTPLAGFSRRSPQGGTSAT